MKIAELIHQLQTAQPSLAVARTAFQRAERAAHGEPELAASFRALQVETEMLQRRSQNISKYIAQMVRTEQAG